MPIEPPSLRSGPWLVTVPADEATLHGELRLPESASGLVVFAHGNGSSRHSPRNQRVADTFDAAGLGSLLIDLLTEEEATERRNVFDLPLLAKRLRAALRWTADDPRTAPLPIGLFGASTGAAAAIQAAIHEPRVEAIVCRGGRPDLAGDSLKSLHVPTLFIVGGADREVLRLNEEAMTRLPQGPAHHDLVVVPHATHLFEEPGALEQVAAAAEEWFLDHLASAHRRRPRCP